MKKLNPQSALPMLFVAALIMIFGGGRLAAAQERFEEELANSSNPQAAGAEDLSTNPVLDFGDAPEAPYPTSLAANGARHVIMPGFFLGNSIDGEPDGQPTASADGDDTDTQGDDEDGILFLSLPLIPGQLAFINVTNSMGPGSIGFLDGWIDFNGDGSWAEPEDRICFSQLLSASGCDIIFFQVPATATPNITTFARFRFSSTGYLSYDGLAQDGEVEDYSVRIGQQEEPGSKWVQYPDLSLEGVDVDVTKDELQMKPPRILADDFECTTSEDLLDIHIWGSWYHDYLPFRCNPTGVMFTLSIHSDIPADQSPTGYSMPGPVLWTRQFQPGQFKACPQRKVVEGWYDPVADRFERVGSFRCWQYSFYLEPGEFRQEGTLDKPLVYWLAVQAQPRDPKARFGWKSSIDHWNDDAVWASPLADDWNEMRYPKGHPYHPESIDMAFQLTYTPEAPEQPTSKPVSHTQCPVVETQCPTVETECPPVETKCPSVETKCPPVESKCPAVMTTCEPITMCQGGETQCPVITTMCPPVETECVQLYTQCPATETECVHVYTQCPATETECRQVKTQCPAPLTECRQVQTQCPSPETECPVKETKCPESLTNCPVVQTQCPSPETECPEESTKCPVVSTQCPLIPTETQCPINPTRCPAPRTFCRQVPTQCVILPNPTYCPEVPTNCPEDPTQCPAVPTECPPLDTECPPELSRCEQISTLCPSVETECPVTVTNCIQVLTICRKETVCPICWPFAEGTKYSPFTAQCPVIETPCPTVVPKYLLTKAR